MKINLEYIFLDSQYPQQLRSKTKIIDFPKKIKSIEEYLKKSIEENMSNLPIWNVDGSSCLDMPTNKSEALLVPVNIFIDPFKNNGLLVLCEIYNTDMTPHHTNTRNILNKTINKFKLENNDIQIGIEQEYFLYDNTTNRPVGWPKTIDAFPKKQGDYYCGVGSNNIQGRKFVEEHSQLCQIIELGITGINAEVSLGQWEYQISGHALNGSDQLWISRYILQRLAEEYNYYINFDPKPYEGNEWNGSGMHVNISTKKMREDLKNKYTLVVDACKKLALKHIEHIAVYGKNNEKRLTGANETCGINQFRYGVGDRTASIRIPSSIHDKTTPGYLEDRRPASNGDPYEICNILIETICGKEKPKYGEALKTVVSEKINS